MSIILQNITKRYGIHTVVRNVSLEIQQGELFVLLGASGSGKSTLLRIIAGLTTAEIGRVFLNGREVTHEPPRKRGTGFVFQNYSLFQHMNVAQNIGFGLEIKKVPRKEREKQIAELLDLVGMAGLGNRYASQLSGGQQQRVALARALAQNPEVLLLDEPFGALDAKIRSQLRESLKEIQDRLGVTTVLVTHDQDEAFELADRIGLLERGHLLEVGDPVSLYHHPRTEFTATFVGGGNVLVGRSVGNQIQLGTVSVPFPKGAPIHDPGAPVRILFRPETLTLGEAKLKARKNLHVLGKGRVVGQVFAGSAHRIRLEMEGLRGVRPLVPSLRYGQHAAHLDAQVISSAAHRLPVEEGQELWVGLSRFHVLAPTGLKLLICVDSTRSGKAAAAFGLKLAEAAQGPTTMLTVTPHQEKIAKVRTALETDTHKQTPSDNVRVTTLVRQGASHTEILNEAQDGIYEIIVLGKGSSRDAERSKLGTTARRVLKQADCPVLLVSSPREQINRMLICTAAGEPGKSVVRFAGRVARRTGATATVLHVQTTKSAEHDHAERYLRQAKVSLEALGVQTDIMMEQGPALAWIIAEADAGDYDLVVIGAPAPQPPRQLGWIDLATHIIAATARPVMIVPMQP